MLRNCFLCFMLAVASISAASAAEVREYKLNDNAASTTVVETYGNNGTLNGGDNTSALQTAGPGGSTTYSFNLDGSADYVTISGVNFTAGNAFTVSLWFNYDTINRHVIGEHTVSVNSSILPSTTTAIVVRTGAGTQTFTVPAMSSGTWYHLFVTRTTGNSVRLFLNGTESSSGALTLAGTLNATAIGRNTTFYFDGKISRLRVFNTDESANVATYYAEGVTSASSVIPQVIISQLPAPQRAWQRFVSLTPIALVQ